MNSDQRKNNGAFPEAAGSAQAQAARTVHDLSAEAISNLSGAAREATQQAKASAASLASEANEQLQDFLRAQIGTGADLAQEAAEAARAFAERLDEKAPHVAKMIRGAANRADGLSQSARDKTPAEIFGVASDYARRQPGAFMGAAVAVGFLAARFLKSSPPPANHRGVSAGADGDVGSTDEVHDA